MLVRVLDHDNGGIDHRANGNGNSAKRHDISINPLKAHHQKSDQYTKRQG